ncbi:MAG: hypothetical protein Q9O74_06380 [Planctomycetota bacterium]|nr:hypothetical protein [Planctomycetota bacterium]
MQQRPRLRVGWGGRIVAVVAACLVCFLPGVVRAQIDLLDQMDQQASLVGEIGITISSVGLNNAARPGEWTGIRVRLVDRGNQQREVLLRIVLTDVDGDDAMYETVVTTNPGVDQPVWAYARLPFDIASTGGFVVQVLEAEEAPADGPDIGFLPGRLLGQTTYRWPGGMSGKATGLLAVVGNTPGGLSGYQQGGADGVDPLGHEVTKLATLTVDALPDRWMGLASIRELIWNGPTPSELRIEQVRAIREWIERGGHLIIILPATGQDWLALGNQELAALLPRVSVVRIEDEPVSALRPLLTDAPIATFRLPDTPVTLHTFQPLADAGPGEADPILNDASGRTVVVSRSVGVGAVTLVGLPGWDRRLTMQGLPEADVFWHRVLGRRGKIATTAEFDEFKQKGLLFTSGRPARVFDGDISGVISKSGRSLVAVMLGLVVFIVYWFVAGPGGFAVLKKRGWSRHAWLAFFGASLVFTGLAWGGATILRPKRVEIAHLSFLDHVYGQRVQRVRTWASMLAPVYGDASIWLDSDDAGVGGSRFQQAVAPWEPSQGGARGSFPDARSYSIDSRSPDRLTFPARATVKLVQLDWAGGLAWDSIRPVVEPDADPFRAVRFTPRGDKAVLRGELVHNFPGDLEDVQIIVFQRQADIRATSNKAMLQSIANAWTLPGVWVPGTPIDLEAITLAAGNTSLASRIDNIDSNGWGEDNQPIASSRTRRYEWLAFFNLFGPPVPDSRLLSQPPVARREATHALDLSRWSTRPCLVVIGILKTESADDMPVPIGVSTNGREREPTISGTTVVRWVYPLPARPPDVIVPVDPDTTQPAGG